jgi:small subunit ribosomal protein S2
MGGIPDIMFVIDTNKEAIAILEARKLNIPVVAILDTNCDPDGITYPIPGNDDAARALQLYCDLIADAVLDGLAAGQARTRASTWALRKTRSSRPWLASGSGTGG